MEKINEECGIFGIFSPKVDRKVGEKIYLALCAQQHRGEGSCGMAFNAEERFTCKKDLGLVSEVFSKQEVITFCGKMAVGQVALGKENALPLVIRFLSGNMAIVYNGRLTNALELQLELQARGVIFQSGSDAEIICSLIARERVNTNTTEEAILKVIPKLQGAYAFIAMTKRKMIAVRDPYGIKPLCMGKLRGSTIFASETSALDVIGAKYVRDIQPGEVLRIRDENTWSKISHCQAPPATCIFEYVYFSQSDSYINGVSVYDLQERSGKYLAQHDRVKADLVCGVPDSGISAALGYAKESKIPYGIALIKNKYVARTWIHSAEKRRDLVSRKFRALRSAIKGKVLILVDDSIVRGTTMGPIIRLLKKAGAKEVHIRIASPLFMYPCPYGSDVTDRTELIAHGMTTHQIRKHIGADSLAFLRLEDLQEIAISCKIGGYCAGCFTGQYPT